MTAFERPIRIGAVLVFALALSGCTAGTAAAPEATNPTVQLGAPGEPNRTMSPDEAAGIEAPAHTEADVEFMRMMILHHDQAITMTGWVDDRTTDRDIRLLAERMRISQEDEMDLMAGWLQDRGTPLRDEHGGHGDHADGMMPGMLTEEQLERLEAAEGEEFERLFLEYMIQHHQGALEMVADLWASDGGQEQEIGQFARHVEGDQAIEIGRMQTMLAERAS